MPAAFVVSNAFPGGGLRRATRASILVAAVILSACSVPSSRAVVLNVPAGGDFQQALDSAAPGDTIVLQAGATYTGSFRLPNKPGSDYITITGSRLSALPPDGARVSPADSANMPKLRNTRQEAVIGTAAGAHHYRLVGLEICSDGAYSFGILELGNAGQDLSQVPHDLELDRLYIHGDPVKGSKRGIALNTATTVVKNSYIADAKSTDQDSQAIGSWNGPGPFKILNNYLEGAGENVIFGGSTPSVANLVPADIEIRGNHFFKPLSWKKGDPSFTGTVWNVKNLFELKNARRVVVQGNVFENNWVQGQNGYAILFTVRTQGNTAPWSVVEDVDFSYNVIKNSPQGINILGHDDDGSGYTRNLRIHDNFFQDIGIGATQRILQLLQDARGVAFEHNTAIHKSDFVGAGGKPSPGFVCRDNLVFHNRYGIIGDGRGPGNPAISFYFPDGVFLRNIIVGAQVALYPPKNFYPASAGDVGFAGFAAHDYRLADSSPFKGRATDGRDPGANMNGVLKAASKAVAGK